MKRLFFTLLLFSVMTSGVVAQQPHDYLKNDPGKMYIPRGTSYHGPTCWAMIFKYYQHNNIPDGRLCSDENCSHVLSFNSELSSDCPTSREDTLIDWIHEKKSIIKAAAAIYYNNGYEIARLYSVYTTWKGTTVKREKEYRLEKIYKRFLQNNIPVIASVPCIWAGRYIVLVGWDKETDVIYYLDPSRKNKIYSVLSYDFLYKNFYKFKIWWLPSTGWNGWAATFYPKIEIEN